ncbi:MAG: TonB-dependent receptor [Gammaproteobacteria bacterium]|nr:TonB-dependent receptor [Gammaproteobacteria bacterium]NNC97385.1 TonB-dependent receptor [Gammaproteobacteria bacterium]NNM13579.1 TonB-dependent receptor [Gammaproteobacteria bacterium]
MNTKIRKSLLLMMGLGLTATVAIAPQTFAADSADVVEEVITVGTRTKARSVTQSPAPVDVFQAEEFLNQGDTDVNNLLRNSVPSYNVNDQPISDAATLIRPANLRGLAPDHTLLLVNGKRRHRGAVITWLGNGISNGSQGADTAAIPALALKSVEVLRDGAAAQYGSDAIAGVINFQLNDSAEGGSFEAKYGEYSEGDGQTFTVAGNVGFPLGDNGFINLTAEWGNSDPTDRAVQRGDAAALDAAGIQGVPNPAMVWGKPIVDDDIKVFANFAIDIGNGKEFYGHGNANTKDVDGGFFYRNPTNRPGVFGDGDGSLLIGDLSGDMSGNCPVGVYPDTLAGLQAYQAWQAQNQNADCFHMTEHPSGLLTGGFTPRFGGEITDNSFLVGFRGETDNGMTWDLSGYTGSNEADFRINNTVNASLGPNTPINFDPGTYTQEDYSLNADFTYPLREDISLGFGAEYRVEEFTISPGQLESFTAGPLADQGFSTSSNGFPGFPAVTSGSWDRSNTAYYLDAEWDASEQLLLQGAVRFEDYQDFGSTTNYKIGGNYRVHDDLGFRATLSTGFKAPTPGQANASNTSTEFSAGVLINNGTIPPTSPVAAAFGGKPLGPEESTNITLGTYFNVGNFDITLDYFDIDVDDRLNLSSEIALTDAQIAQLIADGVPGAGDLKQFRFFTNDFDTNTSGIDLIVNTSTDWAGGTTDWNLAFNHTKTEVTNAGATIGAGRIRQIEETTPENRFNLSGNHFMGDWRFLGRLSYYSEWYDSFENDVFGTTETFDGEFLLDLEVGYDINENSSVLFGINNVTNEKGQKATVVNNIGTDSAVAGVGNVYSTFSPFGFSGTYYYLSYRFTK